MSHQALTAERLIADLTASSNAPPWLRQLLSTIPRRPSDVVPHSKPRDRHMTSLIADAYFHPAIEACLHLCNADLYSAHFLVRKAQGGAKYIDWLHAILHKLETDYRNAKMWYVDLGNSISCPAFREFWSTQRSTAALDSGSGSSLMPQQSGDPTSPLIDLTALQHTDLVALAANPLKFDPKSYFESTTLAADKIVKSGAAFTLQDLEKLKGDDGDPSSAASQTAIKAEEVMQLELVWLLNRMVEEYGWDSLTAQHSIEALKEQSTMVDPERNAQDQEERNSKAKEMILGSTGSRRF